MSASPNTTYNNNSTYFFTTYNASPDYAVAMEQYPIATGMPTGSRTKVIGTTQFLYTVPFYDDHGRVIQTQSSNYTNGIDWDITQYDFSGKPLRALLVHKKNPPNPMGHLIATKYAYDPAGRLLSTRKSMDGPEARIDTMMYNELGQLRAKYFANNLDSLVYDYNIRGWMTGINRHYLAGTANNYFGMELGYDNSPSGITSYANPQFNGNIAGTVWKSAGDGVSRKYDLTYDNVNRLTRADFTQDNGSGFVKSSTVDFSVPTVSYDANGNILSMIQNGYKPGGSSPVDRLRYTYFTNSNRLQQVYDTANEAGSLLGDFHYDLTTKDSATDYAYDANGALTADRNKGIRRIHYNFLNLPDTISFLKPDGSSKGNIVYTYDAQGTKWAKIITDSTAAVVKVTTRLYIKGFEYVNDTLQTVAHEEGRARYLIEHYLNGDSSFRIRFDYFEKDHLGNTRVILTDQKDTAQYVATMEGAYRTKENSLFYNIPATAYPRSAAAGYPVDTATSNPNDSVSRLNGSGQKVGPAIILKVMSGDRVKIATNYYFNSSDQTNGQQLSAGDIAGALAAGIVSLSGPTHGTLTELSDPSSPLLTPLSSFITDKNGNTGSKPNAYLNWVLLDNQFGYVSTSGQSGALQVTDAGTTAGGTLQTPLGTMVNIKTSGYLYIYVSNATPNWDVFFDNLSVMHYAGPMVEENHYYPFGLTMAGISDKALKGNYAENKYRFNGQNELQNKEFSDGSGLETYDATFRTYDPQIGRFMQQDPLADWDESWSPYSFVNDNPMAFSDPLGLTDSIPYYAPAPIVTPGNNTTGVGLANTRGSDPNVTAPPPSSSVPAPISGGGGNNTNTTASNNPNNVHRAEIVPAGITFGHDANRAVVSQYTLNILAGIMQRSGNGHITITSTQRTPEAQANAMLTNIMNHGVQSQLNLYGAPGRQVIGVAAEGLNQHLTRAEILNRMVAEIRRIGPGRVSRHAGDPAVINVLDISPATIVDRQAFVREIRAANINFFQPPRDPAFHLEIRQPGH